MSSRENSNEAMDLSSDSAANLTKKRSLSEDTDSEEHKKKRDSVFEGFTLAKVLNENSQTKMIVVEGRFPGKDESAVVVLEKTPLSRETAEGILSVETASEVILKNDIYGTFQLHPAQNLNGIKCTMIYPATEKHLMKYSDQQCYIVEETPEDYKEITVPILEKETFSIQWVYNILEKKKESERIVFEDADPDTGFILLPDMKWDGKQNEDLYLVGIVHKHGIQSLRTLRGEHLSLLRNILSQGQEAIRKKYGVQGNQLRIYVHYQPSYYHFHVHFTHIKYQAPGSSVEKAHLLSDIIDNICMDPDFYSKKTLTMVLREHDSLCKAYKEVGRL